MRKDSPDDGTKPDVVAEMRAIVEETHWAIEASRTLHDGRPERSADGRAPEGTGPDMLGEISEGLIHAYRFAVQDGDPLTVTLIEKALFHVGRRLAHGMSPAEAGLVCH